MNSGQEPAVRAALVRKEYRGDLGKEARAALQHFDLTVMPGQASMLVGPNGAGKSTALRLIAGMEEPRSGTLTVFGDKPGSMANRRRVGYLPDASELFPFLDVEETLAFFAAAADLGRAETKQRTEELVSRFDMGEWKKKRVRTYSLGMRRRLGLACVLIGRPDLLLLDEPTSGLDPASTRMFLEVCRAEKERGASIVMSSHHLRHAEGLCDLVVVLKRGRVAFSGDVASLAEKVGLVEVELSGFDLSREEALETLLAAEGAEVRGRRISERGLEDFLLGDEA